MPRSNSNAQPSTSDASVAERQEEPPSSPKKSSSPESTRQLPADGISDLVAQLRRELDHLESAVEGSEQEEEHFRKVIAYLQKSQAITWRLVVESDLDAPARALRELDALSSFADRHFPDLPKEAHASVAIHQLLRGLRTADRALHKARITARLRDRELSKIERGILGVLAGSEYQLRRGQIHEKLPESIRPSVARVGQILVDLHHEGLLHRTEAVAQGNPNTAFYGLTLKGREVFRSLAPLRSAEVVDFPKQQDPRRKQLEQRIDELIEEAKQSKGNRIAQGLLESFARKYSGGSSFLAARLLENAQASHELVEGLDSLAERPPERELVGASGG